ncbi:MAG: hypothetical protein Q8L46_01375 [candidate division WWE3 bacterium]|nr:hypothetical protein [candidate division WWE3 bacterium]
MIFVFHGEDQPALREKLLQFRHQYSSTRFWDQELAELHRFLLAPSLLARGPKKELVVVEDPQLKEITREMLQQWAAGVPDVALAFSRRLNPGELAALGAAQRAGLYPAGKAQVFAFFPKIPRSVFPFLDALAARQKSEVLRHAHRLLREGTDVDYLLRMIGWQLNALVRVKEGAFSGLKPYTIEKLKKVTGLWDAARLKQAFSELLREDLRRKKGKKHPLDLLINRLVR